MPPARYFRVFGRRSVAYEAHTFEDSLGTRVGNQRLSLNPVGAQLVESQRGHCSNCVGGEPASVARITCGKHPLAVLDNRILDICRVASDREVRIRAEQVPGAKKGRFPEPYVPLLESAAFLLDSSLAKYKRSYYATRRPTSLTRIAASMTSSVYRLPRVIRNPWMRALSDPVVLFVHPWEFVDLTREDLRYDCRFRTGDFALRALREVIELFQRSGATFLPMCELEPAR